MALTSPENFDSAYLRSEVIATYDRVAREPDGEYHFHRGPEYASKYLGYDYDELLSLPKTSTARFAGVGNPIAIGPIEPGQTVLDHACGGGMDLLLAAKRVGHAGRAIGVDMTPAMRASASISAIEAGLSDVVETRHGMFEDLPVENASVDIVISNGVLNLSPEKTRVFREIYRVLKPGGHLYLADVVVQRELTLDARSDPDLWAACIGGALVEYELPELCNSAGLVDGKVTKRFNCFLNTPAENKVAKDLFVHSINFYARKPV